MKSRRLLLSLLFIIALAGDALHTLHAHHDGSHCSICTLQSHSTGSDAHAETALSAVFLPHDTPICLQSLPVPSALPQTLFGRAPPFPLS